MYLDVNSFKWLTLTKLPVNGFEWIKIKFKIDEDFMKKKDENDIRVKYPKQLHELYNDSLFFNKKNRY